MRTLFLLLAATFMLSACASDEHPKNSLGEDSAPVSTIPWNRPQSWEGTGALGGSMGH